MRASINAQTISITGKLSESNKIHSVIQKMAEEFSSLCIMEIFDERTGHDMTEVTACYDSNEATVKTVKESYSEAKKAS